MMSAAAHHESRDLMIHPINADVTTRDQPRRWARGAWLVIAAAALLTAGGCQGYRLEGKVVRGLTSSVVIVDKDDPRLEEPGLSGVLVEVTLEPESMRPKNAGADVTAGDGTFGLPIRETGAGLLEYEASVTASRKEFKTLFWQFQLPSSSRRMLIIMEEGSGGYRPPKDLLQESIQIGKEITPD